VRRDLDELAQHGALRRVPGGAVRAAAPAPRRFTERRDRDRSAKARPAERTAPLVRGARVVAPAVGTTLVAVAVAERVGTVVTDADASGEHVAALGERGVEVLVG
jgi:DeoR family glycerol-3-phosphate regulon repressor